MATAASERPAFIIADVSGRALVASSAYCDLIGRDRSGIIGHSWEDWVTPDQHERCHARTALVAEGALEKYTRRMERPDGDSAVLAATASRLMIGRKPCILSCIHALFTLQDAQAHRTEHQADVALYIEAMAGGMAAIVANAGLEGLRDSLTSVAGEAAQLAAGLAGRHGVPRLS